jgi:hypothetical protein
LVSFALKSIFVDGEQTVSPLGGEVVGKSLAALGQSPNFQGFDVTVAKEDGSHLQVAFNDAISKGRGRAFILQNSGTSIGNDGGIGVVGFPEKGGVYVLITHIGNPDGLRDLWDAGDRRPSWGKRLVGIVIIVVNGVAAKRIRGASQSIGIIDTVGARVARAGIKLFAFDVWKNDIHPLRLIQGARNWPIRHIGQIFIVILGVLHGAQTDLLQVAHAGRFTGIFPRPGKDGEQNRRQDRDDGDHDQKLNERKGPPETFSAQSILRDAQRVRLSFHLEIFQN